jgi:hypothetical protein
MDAYHFSPLEQVLSTNKIWRDSSDKVRAFCVDFRLAPTPSHTGRCRVVSSQRSPDLRPHGRRRLSRRGICTAVCPPVGCRDADVVCHSSARERTRFENGAHSPPQVLRRGALLSPKRREGEAPPESAPAPPGPRLIRRCAPRFSPRCAAPQTGRRGPRDSPKTRGPFAGGVSRTPLLDPLDAFSCRSS